MQTRRQFVTAAGSSALAVVVAPQALAAGLTNARRAPLVSGGAFPDGVISGDPTPNGIALWTRLEDFAKQGSVDLEVSKDKGFSKLVTTKRIATSDKLNGAVKAQITGLKPYEEYYYRFATRNRDSAVGRFRTALPADSRQPVNFAFFSCQDYTHGFYNAHDVLAGLDVDFVVNLGDYIYDESYHSKADGTGVRDDKIGKTPRAGYKSVIRAAESLDDYRAKYALYRTDPSLRKVHSQFPMITLADDHEVQNNYAGGAGSRGGLPANEGYSRKRAAAAYKAFYENMPHFGTPGERLYRKLSFGRTVDLIVTDQRRYRADQPCGDKVAPPCPDYNDPRTFLGRQQMEWTKSQLASSKAAWKVMANEVMIMPTRVLGGSYFGFDSWDGYPGERQELLSHIKSAAIKDVVFITGDIHTFIAGDVRLDGGQGETVALEFVGGSVTSTGLGEIDLDAGGGAVVKGNDRNPNTPVAIIDALRGINPWVDAADFDHHGFGVVKATQEGFDVTLKRLRTIKAKTKATLPDTGFRYQVARGQTSIKGVNGPPDAPPPS